MRKVAAIVGTVSLAAAGYAAQAGANSGGGGCATYHPQVPTPGRFSKAIDNRYFPLPVRDGQGNVWYLGENMREFLPHGEAEDWPGWSVEAAPESSSGHWSSHLSSPRSSSARSTASGWGSSPSSNSLAVARRSSSCG